MDKTSEQEQQEQLAVCQMINNIIAHTTWVMWHPETGALSETEYVVYPGSALCLTVQRFDATSSDYHRSDDAPYCHSVSLVYNVEHSTIFLEVNVDPELNRTIPLSHPNLAEELLAALADLFRLSCQHVSEAAAARIEHTRQLLKHIPG